MFLAVLGVIALGVGVVHSTNDVAMSDVFSADKAETAVVQQWEPASEPVSADSVLDL